MLGSGAGSRRGKEQIGFTFEARGNEWFFFRKLLGSGAGSRRGGTNGVLKTLGSGAGSRRGGTNRNRVQVRGAGEQMGF